MAKFTLTCLHPITNEQAVFIYDNQTSELTDAAGVAIVKTPIMTFGLEAFALSKDTPAVKKTPKVLKIQLGLSCNYECSYCNQRFVPHAESTNPDDVMPFVNGMDTWVTDAPDKIEFWGGEPLVYWKTLKPLAEALREKYPETEFGIITNGSLLDSEKNEWLDRLRFGVGLSHDGPGYHVRGLDPLTIPEQRAAIMDLWKRLGPDRMSVNAMVHRGNKSRAAIEEFIVREFGEQVVIGEGAYIDPYDEGGIASSLQSYGEELEFRNQALVDMRDNKTAHFSVNKKVIDFIKSIETAQSAATLGQKCSMDRSDNLAVDLNGNVLTCQNTTANSVAPNGESHKLGHVTDMANVKLKTSTHWSKRDECPNCPVLQICKGSCMFLEGLLWETSCNNSFSDNIPYFAVAIEVMTGYIPFYIDGPQREDRKDAFGLINGAPASHAKKPFPIPVVAA
jgi:uncharacterized protein